MLLFMFADQFLKKKKKDYLNTSQKHQFKDYVQYIEQYIQFYLCMVYIWPCVCVGQAALLQLC